jgi:hypothetical protein
MDKGKNWIFAALALGGGFLGGLMALELAPSAVEAAHSMPAVRAQEFELVDRAGTRRAIMNITKGGMADLAMYDGHQRDRTELRVTEDGTATLGFYDEKGARRVLIGAVPGGRDGVTVYGNDSRILAGLTVGANNEASLTLYDPNTGRARAGLGVATTGAPALALFDSNGKDRAELHVGPHGKPGLALADENGKTIAGLPEKEASIPQ